MQIKFSIPNIFNNDLNLVKKIIKSGWLAHGKYTTLFENEIKKFTGSKYCTLVSSCTAGLHLSCIASGFKKGDEIIVPAMTHTATAHAVEYTGAKAVFADNHNFSGNLNLENIKKKVTTKTKGLILVHMSGISCEMDKIISFCKKKNILIIEDCAHALGTKYKKKHVGNFGVTGNFSFYPTKQLTTGEGGAVITNDLNFYNKIKKLKAFGIDKDIKDRKKQGDYDVKDLGFNYRMTDFQASMGYQQIKKYKNNLKIRKKIAKRYIKNLIKSDNIIFEPYSSDNSYFIFQIFCNRRDFVLKKFKELGIGVSVHYSTPVNQMSYYKNKYKINQKDYKNSNLYSKMNISLPVYPKLKNIEIDFICKTLIKLTKNDK